MFWHGPWFISYLNCRTHSVFVGHESTPYGHESTPYVLRPLLFTHPLSTIICPSDLSYHFFADDFQLYKPSVSYDFPVLACCLKECTEDVTEWMGDSKMKMNDENTELNPPLPPPSNLAICPVQLWL